MNILLIRLSSMGDVILTTPLLSYLHQTYPDSRIEYVTSPLYAELLYGDRRIETVHQVSKENFMRDCTAVKNRLYDWVLDLQNSAKSRYITGTLMGTPRICRFDKLHGKRAMLLVLRVNRYRPEDTVIARYFRTAGVDDPGIVDRYPLKVDTRPDNDSIIGGYQTADIFTGNTLALIPFSAWKNKQWMTENFIAVSRHFITKGWRIVILGGPEDNSSADIINEELEYAAINCAGKVSLDETAALLRRCTMALGLDTGLSHCARAVGTPTGLIYGSTTSHFGFFPSGSPLYTLFQTDLWCRPCHAHGGNVCLRGGSRACLRRISAQSVIDGLEQLYIRHKTVLS
jgi:heptosyltransferase-2